MRYHAISLVAVFLALGIGILLGTTLVERGLISEQKGQIKSLRKTFDELKEKNDSLNVDLNSYRDFAQAAEPYMIAGRLSGRSIGVVTTETPDEKTLAQINDSLGGAGGSVPVTIVLADRKVFREKSVKDSLAQLFAVEQEPKVLGERVLAEVVNQLKSASRPEMLDVLAGLGVIQMKGSVQGPLSGAVLVGGKNSREREDLEQIVAPLARSCVAAGFPAVGVTGSDTDQSVLDALKKAGISTVSRVDTAPGQVALVLALEGRGGNYGTGNGEKQIPDYR